MSEVTLRAGATIHDREGRELGYSAQSIKIQIEEFTQALVKSAREFESLQRVVGRFFDEHAEACMREMRLASLRFQAKRKGRPGWKRPLWPSQRLIRRVSRGFGEVPR